jgi:CHAT domain-containing protein
VHRVQGRADSATVLLRKAAAEWEKRRAAIDTEDATEGSGIAVATMFAELGLALLEPRAGHTAETGRREAFEALQAFQARALEERMRGAGISDRAMTHRVSLDSLQRRLLRSGELLIDLVATPDTTLVFAVTRSSLGVTGAPGLRALAPRARVLRRVLESGSDERVTREACERMSSDLFAPLAGELAVARSLVVAGGGPLGALPFAMLPVPGSAELLVESCPIAVTPSANLWAIERRRAVEAAASARVLALGRSKDADGRELAGVAREVRTLGGAYADVTTRLNAGDQLLSAMTGDMARFGALHLAGHSTVQSSSPWRSGILLGRGAGDDAYLRASSVAGRLLPAKLVVLSCCSSAAARGLPGEGLQGLASAFLCSGAVVATLWRVDDEAAARFSQAFYRRLAARASVAAAVREAQLELRDARDARMQQDWAAFTVLGDGEARFPLQPRGKAAPAASR